MTLRTYLALLRLRTLWLVVPFILLGGALIHKLAPGSEHWLGAQTFLTLILLGPIPPGKMLSQAVQTPMHEPFGITLPNLRRNLLKWHLPTLAVLALGLATLTRFHDRSLPLPVAAGVAFAGLCLMLPYEPGPRWFGSRVLFGLITGLYLVAMIFARETRSAMLYAPWFTFALSLGVAALYCRLGFSRQRLRIRACTRVIAFGAAFDPGADVQRAQLALVNSKRIGREWTRRSVGNSTADWLRVVLHETYGFNGGWGRRWALICLIYLTLVFAFLYFHLAHTSGISAPMSLGQLFYQIVWETHPFGGGSNGGLFFIVLLPVLLSAIVALPRPQHLYPLSRERRARLTFVASLLQAGGQMFIAWSGIIALSWIGALVAGVPFRPTAVPDFVVASLVVAPFFPAMFWLKLYGQVRPWERMAVVMFPAFCGGMMPALAGSVHALRAWLLSPIGLAVALTALAASLFIYRAALFNFYRRGDLLQRASKRTNFSLV